MRRYVAALVVVWVLPGAMAEAQAPAAAGSFKPDILQIDDSKNPALVPRWSVRGFVFRVIAGGARQLPSSVLPGASKDEEALVLKEADGIQKIDADCQARLTKVVALIGVESTDVVGSRVARFHEPEVLSSTLLFVLQAQQNAFGAYTPPMPKDMVVIDGAVEPQKIPQWNAWGWAFTIISRGTGGSWATTEIYNKATPTERVLIYQAAVSHMKTEARHDEAMGRLGQMIHEAIDLCAKEEGAIKQAACRKRKFWAISVQKNQAEMAYRQTTLDTRNALRDTLETNQELVAALWQWVEFMKKGITQRLSAKELEAYQRPE